jgi:hypothetical protein
MVGLIIPWSQVRILAELRRIADLSAYVGLKALRCIAVPPQGAGFFRSPRKIGAPVGRDAAGNSQQYTFVGEQVHEAGVYQKRYSPDKWSCRAVFPLSICIGMEETMDAGIRFLDIRKHRSM